jgi:hypothetical protein
LRLWERFFFSAGALSALYAGFAATSAAALRASFAGVQSGKHVAKETSFFQPLCFCSPWRLSLINAEAVVFPS